MSRNPEERPSGAPQHGRASTVARRPAERRRSPPSARIGSSAPVGAITLTVMRAMIAAADALRAHLDAEDRHELAATELTRPGSPVADLVRHYQVALRHFVKDWLRDRRQMAWLVHASSGRTLAIDAGAPTGPAFAADTEVVLAEDQPLNGVRRRLTREGLGLPVACRSRRAGPDPLLDAAARFSAARPWTVVVAVERHADRRVRTVRVALLDPTATATHTVGGVRLPLAADFTAPVALTIGLERKPAQTVYGIRDATRRGTVDGFSALTPLGDENAPLVLVEGAGQSLTTMAQIANEVAGDPMLRERYQVWLYRYPAAAPLFFAASAFRADLARFLARIATATGRTQAGRAAIIARGPGALVAKSLLTDSGSAVWDAVFTVPPERLNLASADRALLQRLFHWTRVIEIDRVLVLGEPQNAETLVAGVGARAVQMLQRQPVELRGAIERIYGRAKSRLVAPLPAHDVAASSVGEADGYPEPICDAIAAIARAADHAVVTLVAAGGDGAGDARLYRGSAGLRPVESRPLGLAGAPLATLTVRGTLDWLRPRR